MARYVAEGVDVHVVTCTGGERGSMLNPRLQHDESVLANLADDPPPRDGHGARDPRSPPGLARLGRLRAARGRSAAAAARGLLRADGRRRRRRAARTPDPVVPAAGHDDLRRERRLPAPRPHHVPQDRDARLRRGGRPGGLPRRRAAVAGAEDLLQPDLHQGAHHGAARGDARGRARVAVRRVARALGGPRGAPDHGAGAVRRLLRGARPRAARPRDPGRPRRCLVPLPARPAARGLADRGLRAGQGGDRRAPARGRPVRRDARRATPATRGGVAQTQEAPRDGGRAGRASRAGDRGPARSVPVCSGSWSSPRSASRPGC